MAEAGQSGKKFVYVEPSRRVKEILEEELYFRKEACHVKHPAAVAVEGIWSVKKNFSIGSLKPVSQNRNGLLLQPQFYSRHAGMKMASVEFFPSQSEQNCLTRPYQHRVADGDRATDTLCLTAEMRQTGAGVGYCQAGISSPEEK
ncbi:PREDICTED: uncharacterized protein LOC103926062 [Pygoscelis adeliae]|uniref:uncharacterized protein LOC103926062 n=1 Tax=Pygoscelis adeliae TaxID=9238 RepID=UPI0004F4D847|nr:PREDICTED: uncharacterized protein LOC103926062 [Pygoscelis adeliae]